MHAHKEALPRPSLVDLDPEDPSQVLNDNAEAAEDGDVPIELDLEPDTGDLYGLHTSPAGDRALAAPEDHDAFVEAANGENWLEALEQQSAEGGPTPEHEVVIVDDSDPQRGPPPTDFRDRPKADRGSGGPGGM
jgi:hypothetical protein